jgi:hypothetical protein
MQKDMLQSIDDSALEAVSGGGVGEIIAHVREVRAEVRAHVREHVAGVVDHVADTAGAVLSGVGVALQKIGSHLAD